MFSHGITVQNSDMHAILDKEMRATNHSKPIIINDHVWVAMNSIILKGSYISKNSVIAAGSIVTKKFNEENVIIAGIPAKIIRRNIGGWSRKAASKIIS